MVDHRRCLECNKVVGKDARRGLCRHCYRDPIIRDCHETLPRGTWKDDGKSSAWSFTEEGRLKVMFRKGKSDREIARELGRSEGSVCKKRQRSRYGTSRLKVSPARQAINRKKRVV